MQQALIDIGSNSMRLTVFDVRHGDFKVLFKQKYMAGLAGYVEDGRLTTAGILRACSGLSEFRNTLNALGIKKTNVFATASLRNIDNTEEALHFIQGATGYQIEVISGKEEAAFGYAGAMIGLENIRSGSFVDIGGASTEVVKYEDGKLLDSASFKVGSLSLFKHNVRKILPGLGSFQRMEDEIKEKIDGAEDFHFSKYSPLVCTGGTSRAVMKIARSYLDLPESCTSIDRYQLNQLYEFFYKGGTPVRDLILRIEPERIHTLIPGSLILRHIAEKFQADEIIVSKYGVREGYLCQRLIKEQ